MTQTITPQQDPLTLAWQSTEKGGLAISNGGHLHSSNGDGYVLPSMSEKAAVNDRDPVKAVHGDRQPEMVNGHELGLSQPNGFTSEKTPIAPTVNAAQSPAMPAGYEQAAVAPNQDTATAPMIAKPDALPSAPVSSAAQTAPSTGHTIGEKSNATAGPSRHILSSYVAANPSHTVKRAMHAQFPKPNPIIRLARRFKVKHSVIKGMTEKEWKHYNARGAELRKKAGWRMEEGEEGTPVGELFWKMYLSLMPTLERDPLSGLTTPDLLGSTSTFPLTIISLIPDIMRHYHDVIVRAKKEVFLATNYWQPSNSVQTITNSLKELSEIVVKEKREKIVVKIMYDRGSVEQLWNSHAPVESDKWAAIDLPKKEDVPGLDLQVINFHRVLLGTFHAKFLIVDRKVALINSNNIQDRPNLELMSHLEGPIVDSFYEVALHSWYNALTPSLPCIGDTYSPPTNASGEVEYLFSDKNPYLADIEVVRAAREARTRLRQETLATDAEMSRAPEYGVDRLREAVRRVVDQQRQSLADWRPGERIDESVQNAMHELREIRDRWASNMGNATGRSRPNSRGPSRRSSAHEGMLRTLMRGGGDRPGEYTIAHAPLHPANGQSNGHDEESEAPSSPTMTDIPVKAHTMPTPGANPPGGDDRHVAFAPLEVNNLDTSANGHFMDGPSTPYNPPKATPVRILTESPIDKLKPSPMISGGFTASPVSGTGSMRPPDSPVRASSAQASPILKPSSGPGMAGLGHSPLAAQFPAQANGINGHVNPDAATSDSSDPHVAFSGITPAKGEKTVAEKVADRTVAEELSKESEEIADDDAGASAVNPPFASVRNGDRSETATLDGLPLSAVGPGAMMGNVESEVPEGKGTKRLYKMSKMFNAAGVLSEAWATVEDSDELDNFQPHVIHKPHAPVPVAMCCRKPHGFPGHHDIRNPQNAAWLAGFRYAKKKVFVQSPTLNARPIVRAIKQACRRGVEVILLLDLGFNDKGESIPFQGGTNEEVVDRLYKTLGKEKKEQHLKVYWYTGKDQVRPLNAVKKQRNCHIKFAAYDDEVLIIGNGNQDSQSWFHSQEVNVMVDSKEIVAEMMETLLSNQNTIEYGLVDTDGIWRDAKGKTLKDYGATSDGKFRGLSGFIQFAKTI